MLGTLENKMFPLADCMGESGLHVISHLETLFQSWVLTSSSLHSREGLTEPYQHVHSRPRRGITIRLSFVDRMKARRFLYVISDRILHIHQCKETPQKGAGGLTWQISVASLP